MELQELVERIERWKQRSAMEAQGVYEEETYETPMEEEVYADEEEAYATEETFASEEEPLEDGVTDGGEVAADVQMQAKRAAAVGGQEGEHGLMHTGAGSAGEVCGDVAPLEVGADSPEQGAVHDAIAHRRGGDEARLGVVDQPQAPGPRLVEAGQ